MRSLVFSLGYSNVQVIVFKFFDFIAYDVKAFPEVEVLAFAQDHTQTLKNVNDVIDPTTLHF